MPSQNSSIFYLRISRFRIDESDPVSQHLDPIGVGGGRGGLDGRDLAFPALVFQDQLAQADAFYLLEMGMCESQNPQRSNPWDSPVWR